MAETLEQRGDELLLRLRVQPKASRVRVYAEHGTLKVSVTAPPAEGLANKMVCNAVANWLEVPKSNVRLHSGDKSRDKVLAIAGLEIEAAREIWAALQR